MRELKEFKLLRNKRIDLMLTEREKAEIVELGLELGYENTSHFIRETMKARVNKGK